MRALKVATWIVCLLIITSVAFGEDPVVPVPVDVNLGVADPATPRTYAAEAGKPFDIHLTNAVPNKKYEIVGDKQVPQEKKVNVPPASEVKCEATDAQVARIVAKIKEQKKAKAPAAEKDKVEVTEADIAAELEGDSVCTADATVLDAAKKTLDDEKKKLDDEKAKPQPSEIKIKDADIKVKAAQAVLEEEKKNVDAAQALLNAAKQTLDDEKKKLDEEKAKTPPNEANVQAAQARVQAAQTKVDDEKKKVDSAQGQHDVASKALEDAKVKLNEEKAKVAFDKAKVKDAEDRVNEAQKKFDAEKKKVDDAQKDLDALKGTALPQIRKLFQVTFGTYNLKPGESLPKTFKATGEEITWPIVITTQGSSAATTAKAAAKAADPLASDSPNLDDLLARTRTQPEKVVGTCDYSSTADCTARIFINADQISTLTITRIPADGKVTVRVTGGEFFPCKAVEYNIATYEKAPTTLIVPLHMRKGFLGLGNRTVADAEAEAASIYGIDWCPKTNRPLKKNRMFHDDPPNTDYAIYVKDRENARRAPDDQKSELKYIPDPRVQEIKTPPIASLPLFLRGLSQEIVVEFAWAGGLSKTFVIPVVYQRFWLDAGGFFVFTRRTDQSIVTSTVTNPDNTPSTPERQKVLAINRQTSFEPSTGIVINVHQGDFPILAYQFGISANQSRLPSYYLGIGIRAREIGKRGLATIGIGAAMQQETRFPLLENGSEIPSTDDRLKPVNKYGVTFPYISLSLGFSFGGVSEKTNVADSVQP